MTKSNFVTASTSLHLRLRTLALGLLFGTASSGALATPFVSASGLDGGGLGMKTEQRGRVWGEAGFFAGDGIVALAPTFGVGIMPAKKIEVSFVVPTSFARLNGQSVLTGGNVFFGASYVEVEKPLRLSLGLGVALPTSPVMGLDASANHWGTVSHGMQHGELRIPGTTSLSAPLHFEMGQRFVASLDVTPQWRIAADRQVGGSNALVVAVAPGMAVYGTESLVLGLRAPLYCRLSRAFGDPSQSTIEPYVRYNAGSSGFFAARFNLPIDAPLSEMGVWGLHVGGGAAF